MFLKYTTVYVAPYINMTAHSTPNQEEGAVTYRQKNKLNKVRIKFKSGQLYDNEIEHGSVATNFNLGLLTQPI